MPKFVSEDGRAFTDYNPNCQLNNYIQRKYNITNAHEYRSFLQSNASKLMKDLCVKSEDCKFCPVCKLSLEYKP